MCVGLRAGVRLALREQFEEEGGLEDGDLICEIEKVPVAADEDRLAGRSESDEVIVSGICGANGRRRVRIIDDRR